MALYKLKEFAEVCGLKQNALSNAKARGKIIVNEDRMVDTGNPANAVFLELHRAKSGAASDDPGAALPVPKSAAADLETGQKAADAAPGGRQGGELFKLDREKKAIDIEKAKQDLELSRIKEQKIRGELIPTSLVRDAFTQLFGAFTVSFRQGSDNLITEWTQIAHLNRNQQADLRKRLVKIVNSSIDAGIDDAKNRLDAIVEGMRKDL